MKADEMFAELGYHQLKVIGMQECEELGWLDKNIKELR
jgi:hypothetical protein